MAAFGGKVDSVGPPADIWLWHLSDMPAYPETFTGVDRTKAEDGLIEKSV